MPISPEIVGKIYGKSNENRVEAKYLEEKEKYDTIGEILFSKNPTIGPDLTDEKDITLIQWMPVLDIIKMRFIKDEKEMLNACLSNYFQIGQQKKYEKW